MSESHKQMVAVLRETVVPELRGLGFSGSFPHFRRFGGKKIDLLTFQFNRYGGSFVVEIACCNPKGFTTHWGKQIPPNKVSAHDLHANMRLRLHPDPANLEDRWFYYEPHRTGIYQEVAVKMLSIIHSEAEEFWGNQPVA